MVRFLGNPLPDPSVAGACWPDPVLQALYDAVHAAALSLAGTTSLLHEAKVDVVTVPNLSEHLSSAETTEQLSARFAYAAAMKSMNNLLLLCDGESWSVPEFPLVCIGDFLIDSNCYDVDIAADAAPVRWFGDDEIQAPKLRDFVAAIAAGRLDV